MKTDISIHLKYLLKFETKGKKQTIKGIFQHLLFFYTNHSLVLLVYIHHMILH